MTKKKLILILVLIILIAVGYFVWTFLRGTLPAVSKPNEDISKVIENIPQNSTDFPLKLLDGFSISIFAKDLGAPRVMAYDPVGNILVSVPSKGKVLALLPDKNGDGMSDETKTIISGLKKPHGIAFKCPEAGLCKIYIAETDKVVMYDYDEKNLKLKNPKDIVDLPSAGGHTTRTLMFLPYSNENKLLISVGSSCNVCDEKDWRRAKILVVNADGSDLQTYARGLRNSVFMAIHPVNGKIWATEMGRDLLGDNLPPDEINIIDEGSPSAVSGQNSEHEALNFGWPICYGKNIHDTNFDREKSLPTGRQACEEPFETESYIDIPAHSAPLGMAFFPEEGWPENYWFNLLVAYHGSWNRTEPTGYKIVRYILDANGKYIGEEDFITGWLNGSNALGRPVDIMIQPGGTIFISDDKAGVIYRVKYNKEAR
ncbi:hypothetical protein A2W48_00105 [Candidatus Giovannonibacteria bacterium RIFCSPHIGHO2_12_44_12]|uniref:Pyrroloquinoline quinone-dependent pyranose dehydrogenase beta-propeller domain-containing protein n=3 Tax=Candidatus Giovannoniibacteriota TaxID=1752738 RepID=A0A1F5X1I8_9BACT|nr:MAG: hypothetical protein A2W57_03380 [Candidatus Giovannonibacteria bacterium RIFCSPHIGHO2_02_43_16]OGF81768.1 MAG: hypothetical protein A2W48_00105 [Candidatus Giovannonibacteria bacterium RIFCSPHIGHO2_12_44_12]OGF85419.1 MAG: hypothetical protein A2Z63_00620 [Candidatus Giovannonibacteria bacterium RIFCSPLOWO2_02_44_8]